MTGLETITFALLGGVLPALVWLLFWLREDRKNPEPNNLIARTFLLGMLAVALVIPFQLGVQRLLPNSVFAAVLFFAFFEELLKFGAGYFGGLHSIEDNEPIDPIIYMITAALGFAALENALFIFGPLLGNEVTQGILTGNYRFIGATLLHVVSSGIIGIAISFWFYASRSAKAVAIAVSFAFAVLFHFIFNALIILFKESGMVASFITVWIGVVLMLLAFEKAKTIAPLSGRDIINPS